MPASCTCAISDSGAVHACELQAGHAGQHVARVLTGKRGRPKVLRWRTTIDHLPRTT